MAADPATQRITARELVANYVRRAILTGEFPPGRKLQVAELADTLGVSHTPTREGLQLLATEGLVRLHAYRGAQVSPLSADEYEEVFLMRVSLEGLAARLGSERITSEGLAEMKRHLSGLARCAKADDVNGFVEADRAFHATHYLASGRTTLWERIISLRFAAERYTRLGYSLVDVGMSDTVRSHRELFALATKHDGPASEKFIMEDLNRTFDHVHRTLLEDSPAQETPAVRTVRRA